MDIINFIQSKNGIKHKKELIKEVLKEYPLNKERSVYTNGDISIRFSESKKDSMNFSNTVLSIKNLVKYDKTPFYVVLVTPSKNYIMLSNTTFLSKIGHSSKNFTELNLSGSFNGGDIMKVYKSLLNEPSNFAQLFAEHEQVTLEDNIQRLVEATDNITGKLKKFSPSDDEYETIIKSVERNIEFLNSAHYQSIVNALQNKIALVKDNLIKEGLNDNVNLRGRTIENLLTTDNTGKTLFTSNALNDYEIVIDKYKVGIDIKSKLLNKGSNPKGYNIDKFLKFLAEDNSVYLTYLVGIDDTDVKTALLSPFDTRMLESSSRQTHWSGKDSRGTIQYNGKILHDLLNRKYKPIIEKIKAEEYLKSLIE